MSETNAEASASKHQDGRDRCSGDFDALDIREDSEGWSDLEDDTETLSIQCLLCHDRFSELLLTLHHLKGAHDLDFAKLRRQHDLDFLQCVKLVNFIRGSARGGSVGNTIFSDPELWKDDKYLLPVLEDDAFIVSLDELDAVDPPDAARDLSADGKAGRATAQGADAARIAELEQELARIRADFSDYRSRVSATLEERWAERAETTGGSEAKVLNDARQYEEGYFESYAHSDIHQTMLQDAVRTDAYRDFIYGNKHIFKDKVVLDVGCGTGILSMFCAKAGAKKVIAIDNSDIITKGKEIAATNGLNDRVTFVRAKVEELSLLPNDIAQVDIIVSEWMGYCLLFEDMLPSVLYARDKWLRPDGLLVPSHCSIHMAPLAEPDWMADNIDFWRDVYGFDMSSMLEGACDDVVVRSVPKDAVCGQTKGGKAVKVFDLYETKAEDLQFSSVFEVVTGREIDALDAWCVWFDICFSPAPSGSATDALKDMDTLVKEPGAVTFTTSPFGKQTHWQSGFCVIDRKGRAGEELKRKSSIKGSLRFAKGREARALEIEIDWATDGSFEAGRQRWKMR